MAEEMPTIQPAPSPEEMEAKRKAALQEKVVEFETEHITQFLKNAKQRSVATQEFKDTIQSAIDLFKSPPRTTIPS
jgi:hypothetical protein